MLRGDIRDFNRSTADAALHFAESQVFEPERQEFDFIVNRKLLAEMGIRFWRFVSKSPVNPLVRFLMTAPSLVDSRTRSASPSERLPVRAATISPEGLAVNAYTWV